MDKITKKKNEKFEKLLSSAFTLFEEKGITSVSIDEIVKAAGVAKGTFYLYFKDKMDLISTLILNKANLFLNAQKKFVVLADANDFHSNVQKYLDAMLEFLSANKTLTELIDKNTNICVDAVIENCEGPIQELYNNILKSFADLGFSAEEVKIRMHIYIEMIVSLGCSSILRETPCNLGSIKSYLYDIIISSIQKSEAIR